MNEKDKMLGFLLGFSLFFIGIIIGISNQYLHNLGIVIASVGVIIGFGCSLIPEYGICEQCGNQFIRKHRNHRFCSRECANQHRRKRNEP